MSHRGTGHRKSRVNYLPSRLLGSKAKHTYLQIFRASFLSPTHICRDSNFVLNAFGRRQELCAAVPTMYREIGTSQGSAFR